MKTRKMLFVSLFCLVMPIVAMDAPEQKTKDVAQNNLQIKLAKTLQQLCKQPLVTRWEDQQLREQEVVELLQYNLSNALSYILGSAFLTHPTIKQKLKTIFLQIPVQESGTLPHNNWVYTLTYNPEGNHVASGFADGIIKIWNLESQQLVDTLTDDLHSVTSPAYNPHGNNLSCTSKNTIKIWNLETQKLIGTLTGHTDFVSSVAYNPDGKHLASGSFDKTVRIWDLEKQKIITTLTGYGYICSVTYSPDGKYIGIGSSNVEIYDLKKNLQIAPLTGHTDLVNSVAFSSNGKHLASGSTDQTIKTWNLEIQQEVGTLTGHTDWVSSVAYRPDGKHLASASKDKTVKIWDLDNQKLISTLTSHVKEVTSVAFSPNGKLLASGSYDKTVRLWDLRKLNAALYILDNEVSLSEANAAVEWAKKDDKSEIPIKKLQILMKKE